MNTSNMTDTYYVGRSDMLQTYVDGIPPSLTNTNFVQCRLGYWRFDSPLLYAEQGQMPLSSSCVGLAPSWSGTALVISNTPGSQVTYPDVGSNGWANINCRQGSLRFWFMKTGDTSTASAPFVYMGSPNGTNQWTLEAYKNDNTLKFITCTNQAPVTILSASASCLSTSNWTQIVLTYGTNSCALYTNGVLAATGPGNTNWPSLSNRQLGMVIGNGGTYEGSINGQFEEMETFNYELTAGEIAANFQIVSNVDSDLDGIPDYLEDIGLATSRAFLGAPVVITGTIEAEQFDMGGRGIAYYNVSNHPASPYRPTGMFISPVTNDTGAGYCLDQTQQGDWAQYTINVLVAQTYLIETRVAGITATGAVFQVEFTNNSGFYTNSGHLIIPTTNWNIVTNVVYLPSGTIVMKLQCLTNAPGATNVGRFNYISVYPYWTPPTNGPKTNTILSSWLMSGSNYFEASNNAYVIQTNVNTLPTNGGMVTIPTGTWYVSQAVPNDALNAPTNAAVCITNSNITIAGTNTNATNTVLIANNRSTTIVCLGANSSGTAYQCSNFTLCDLTLEAQPHEVAVTNTSSPYGYTNGYELGQLNTPGGGAQGSIAVFFQNGSNICISNCIFLHGVKSLYPVLLITNFMVVNCQILPMDTNCFFTGTTNNAPTNTSNTTNWQGGNVGIFGNGPFNAVIISNTYIGNSALTMVNTSAIGTKVGQTNILAPDGFVWFQSCGNVFVARNTISNNELEGIQLDAGPSAVVGNTYDTLVNEGSCCALNAWDGGDGGLGAKGATGYNFINYSTCFVGNSVYGGRCGELGGGAGALRNPFIINFSGNSLDLYPPFDVSGDYPGAAVAVEYCQAANVCGNTLSNGGHGFLFTGTNASALILNNNFSNAAYRGIGYMYNGDSLSTAQIFGNSLGQGVSFHVQLPYANSFAWFLGSNTYVTTNSIVVPLFADPASSAVHISN